jgi:hypothetical protein
MAAEIVPTVASGPIQPSRLGPNLNSTDFLYPTRSHRIARVAVQNGLSRVPDSGTPGGCQKRTPSSRSLGARRSAR